MSYDFRSIEEKWLPRWESDKAWAAPRVPGAEKRYVLEMFPYPSGETHVGHVENYTIGDAIARFWRMQGFDVLHPMGYDAFGLPAENAAIKHGIHPRDWTYANMKRFTNAYKRLAFSYDWDRSFATCDPSYYRWNQWLFLRLLDKGLAYRAEAKVNWCPSCRTVLANEQISAGVCWRCGSVPEVRDLPQWFFRTTAYAQELLDGMGELNWKDNVLVQQRNWIGRSDGATLTFRIAETDDQIPVFTTRPDTLYGVTFLVLAPEHPVAHTLALRAGKTHFYEQFADDVRRRSDIDRQAIASDRKAFDLEATAINPLSGERVPVFASDYVLMGYGTGAIMGVPGHDTRDYQFATQYSLSVKRVIESAEELPYSGEGVMVNSGPFDGTDSVLGRCEVIDQLETKGLGSREIQFRLRDWLVSRQRYWGTPIPVVHCDACGIVGVPDADLPVTLPDVVDFKPTGDAVSPLATATDWVAVDCPACGGPGRRETDTMDTFVDSSWYFLRFCDALNDSAAFDLSAVNAWMPVDQYTGGVEHAVMHLIYARFVTRVLRDMGLVEVVEPFQRLMNHGTITMGGKAMSKSLGNVVDPGEVLDRFGADAIRVFVLFIGPPEADYDWPAEGADAVIGSYKFCERVWKLVTGHLAELRSASAPSGAGELRKLVHQKLKVITGDFERFSFNTAIARMMELTTALSKATGTAAELREGVDVLLRCLAPICPYLTEELWSQLGGSGSIHSQGWPVADDALARVDRVVMVVQIDSKVRDRLEVDAGITEEQALTTALGSEKVLAFLHGGAPTKVIARPPGIINLLTT